MNDTGRLLITCPDRPGILSAVSSFFSERGSNITILDQYSTDPTAGKFFMRLEFQLPDLLFSELRGAFKKDVALNFDMQWKMTKACDKKRMAIFVSRHDHALLELLWLYSRSELHANLLMVISNHDEVRNLCESFGIAFHHIPVSSDNKADAESAALALLKDKVDFIVLARYMQVLTPNFVSHFPRKIINIHHSFLPAFVGADPYRQAHDRGVKIIGATAHYVTEELDQGPIIEQDVARVSHNENCNALRVLGRSLERQVLAKAVALHLADKIIVDGNKTVVF